MDLDVEWKLWTGFSWLRIWWSNRRDKGNGLSAPRSGKMFLELLSEYRLEKKLVTCRSEVPRWVYAECKLMYSRTVLKSTMLLELLLCSCIYVPSQLQPSNGVPFLRFIHSLNVVAFLFYIQFILPSSQVPQIQDDPFHVCNTLLGTYHTYIFISSIIYGHIFFFTYCKSYSGGGAGTFMEYCPRLTGFCSCRRATIGKPTQRDADVLPLARKSRNRSAGCSLRSLTSWSLKVI